LVSNHAKVSREAQYCFANLLTFAMIGV